VGGEPDDPTHVLDECLGDRQSEPGAPFGRDSEASPWANRVKIFSWNSAEMPGPRSRTSTRSRCGVGWLKATETAASRGENLMAFESRLVITCKIRCASTRAIASVAVLVNSKVTWC
jgi:hypothetical protein